MTTTCTVCGHPPVDSYELSMHGEATCVAHPAEARCALCSRPRHAGEPGWYRFTATTVRCPTCTAVAVETQDQARQHIPRVREEMAALGIRLGQRVRVTLVEPDDLNLDGRGLCLGRTIGRTWEGSPVTEVVGIHIARGLTATHFGSTVAHEIGHAWLAQQGARHLDLVVEEGVCELFAGAWLKRQRTAFADTLRQSALDNPDPVYGAGYRRVREAVVRHGIEAVLSAVCRRGTLP
ncbi:protein DA1 [Lentzea sp. NPDC004782]|uniref:protein DA1 n=1 Tax=Lentzea sp. NPDC004782 TaxID=3154458 RepID=UPI0033AE4C53